MKKKLSAYADAGVNIDSKMSALSSVKKLIKKTNVTSVEGMPNVLSGIGSFGGMFASPGKGNVLVASTDGVGTKLKIATMAGRHNTVGQDLVNHCVNDILVHGAEPLFFLDYFGTAGFEAPVFKSVIAGICKACRENGCALIAGETAELPGVYQEREYDLVGTIVGVVPENKIITGTTIRPDDVIIGLSSSGLHTNGYSLARKIIFEKAGLAIDDILPGTKKSVADILLAVHKSYLKPIAQLKAHVGIHGMAHITGGGFQDNIPRVLPSSVDALIDRSAWKIPLVFNFLQERGDVDLDEMYRVFNMGIGLVVFVRKMDARKALDVLRANGGGAKVVGRVESGCGVVRFV